MFSSSARHYTTPMRTPPFYSYLRGMALASAWHDNNECPIAQSIPLADRIPGTDPFSKRCTYCELLDTKAVPGSVRYI